jgi:hypothetical protein
MNQPVSMELGQNRALVQGSGRGAQRVKGTGDSMMMVT